METVITEQLYAVVYHHQYSPKGYRVYRTDDAYLEEYPSMYRMIEDRLSQQAAESLSQELNEREWELIHAS
jgi:hypothetical protein